MKRHLHLVLAGVVSAAVVGLAPIVRGQQGSGLPIAQQFESLHYRSIGPASMSGRISDFAVYEANTAIFWVGSAHGGLWKTTNGGATFTGQFQQNGLMSIGAVAVSQKNANLVWLGTGEGTNRQSISWGSGVYKSTDGGTTWKSMGLGKSFHIQRLVIDPTDDNIVLAAVQGALFGPGGDRGVYKTTDGGATWKQVVKVDDDTGANDIAIAASDHKIMYASTYQRRRTQCCMNGGGPGSGIWKSTDGGDTWTKLSGGGLPGGSLGRIGLDVYRRSANIVYATIEAETAAGGGRGGGGGGGGAAGGGAAGGDTGVYRTDDGGTTWRKVNGNNPRPMYFSQIRVDPNNPDRTILGGVRMTISLDGGKTQLAADPSVHDDKHALWWDPNNSDHILIGTDGGAYVSWDMTRSWIWYPNLPVGLFYHVGYDMETPYNVCGGMQDNYDWCGPSAVRTRNGIANDRWQTVQGGDGFVAIPDLRDGRIVYSESQDGNTMRHNRVTGEAKSIRPSAQNVVNAQVGAVGCDPPAPGGGGGGRGGGGGPCAPYRFNWDTPMLFSPTDPGVLYIAGNHVFRTTDRGDSWTAVSPDLTTNANREDVVTMGLKGSDVRISKNDGISAWPTIVSFAESAKQPGLYYAGTDDGIVGMSKDAGKTWDKAVAERLPGFVKGGWVSKVMPSRYDAGTVYIASDAHRLNDYETHIWVSNDFGANFRSLNGNLKGEAIKTLTEDQRNPDVIYAGSETGLFVTLDRGKNWSRLQGNFPHVRVDEITLHPRDNAMLLATHGRSLWILDHLSPIQEYAAAQGADAHLFSIDPALQWRSMDDKNDEFWGHQFFVGENPPTDAVIQYLLKNAVKEVKLKITDSLGKDVRMLTAPANRLTAGIQTVCWDMRVEPIAPAGGGAAPAGGGGRGGGGAGGGRGGGGGIALPQPEAGYSAENPCGGGGAGGGGGRGGGGASPQGPYVLPGTYNVTLMVDGKAFETKPMKVVIDPELQMNDVQRKKYYDTVMDLHEMQKRGEQMTTALNPLYPQMNDVAEKLKTANNVPAAVKTQFDALKKDFDAIRVKFGVPQAAPGAGGGRGGGGAAPAAGGQAAAAGQGGGRGGAGGRGAAGGGAGAAAAEVAAPETAAQAAGGGGGGGFGFGGGAPANPDDLVAKAGTLKGQMMSFTEVPSDTLMKQYTDVKLALPKAMTDANAFLLKAMTVSQALKKYDIALTVPAPIK